MEDRYDEPGGAKDMVIEAYDEMGKDDEMDVDMDGQREERKTKHNMSRYRTRENTRHETQHGMEKTGQHAQQAQYA